MRLLTAGSLVRAQQGEPEKSALGNRCAFSFAKRQRPCALIAARADGVRKSKTERTNKRRGAAVTFAGAERARWAMQRGGGGPGNRAMGRGPAARGAARQFPGSEWSLVRAGQGEPRRAGLHSAHPLPALAERAFAPFRPPSFSPQNPAMQPFTGALFFASGNRCAFSFVKTQRPCALIAARTGGVKQSRTGSTNKWRGAAVPFAGAGQRKIKQSKERRTSPAKDRCAVPF